MQSDCEYQRKEKWGTVLAGLAEREDEFRHSTAGYCTVADTLPYVHKVDDRAFAMNIFVAPRYLLQDKIRVWKHHSKHGATSVKVLTLKQ